MNNIQRWFKRNAIAEKKESQGKFEEAIQLYESNVDEGAETLFSYERLVILYKRQNDIVSERRIILKALDKLKEREKQGRLDEGLASTRDEMKLRLKQISKKGKNSNKKGWFSKFR